MCERFGGEGRQWRAKANEPILCERSCGGGGVTVWGKEWFLRKGGY